MELRKLLTIDNDYNLTCNLNICSLSTVEHILKMIKVTVIYIIHWKRLYFLIAIGMWCWMTCENALYTRSFTLCKHPKQENLNWSVPLICYIYANHCVCLLTTYPGLPAVRDSPSSTTRRNAIARVINFQSMVAVR